MSLTRFFIEIFGCVATIFVFSVFCKIFLVSPSGSRFRRVACAGTAYFLSVGNVFFVEVMQVRVFVTVIWMFLFTYCYDSTFLKRIYSVLIGSAFLDTSEIVTGVITITLLKVDINSIRESDLLYVLNVLASKVMPYLLLKLVAVFTKKGRRRLDGGFSVALTVLFIFILFHTAFFINEVVDSYSGTKNVLAVISMILMGAAVIAVFFLNDRQLQYKENQIKLREMENQYKLQVRNYENLRENTRAASKNIHDVKNFALAVESYLEQGRVEEAKKKLQEYTEQISSVSRISSGSQTVDALLEAKEKEMDRICKERYISVVLGELVSIDEIDLCILLGNAIDNAIEESRRIENTDDRVIEIRVLPCAGGVSVFVRNKVSANRRAVGVSLKKDAFSHGFGIENMKAICDKYNGDFQVSEKDGYFELSAFLPNNQAEQPNRQELLKAKDF